MVGRALTTKEQVQQEFATRQQSVNASVEQERAEKEKEKERRTATRRQTATVRSGAAGEEEKINEESLMVP